MLHIPTMHEGRVVCECGDFNCGSLDATKCLQHCGGGIVCQGDRRLTNSHHVKCPSAKKPLLRAGDRVTIELEIESIDEYGYYRALVATPPWFLSDDNRVSAFVNHLSHNTPGERE